jgi:2-polyprenyl-3-methyl-5-hydroxy-6-metoxy-1,4-benzoquinol methylase
MADQKHPQEQKLLYNHFNETSGFWTDIYQRNDVLGAIFRRRQTVALNYINELSLPKTSRVLEIGCGAGFLAIALATKGYTVHATDRVPAMIKLTQKHAKEKGVESRIHTVVEDIYNLTFKNQSIDLVVALGVVIWLEDLKKALAEIARVLTPDGYIVLSINNLYGAHMLLDPLLTPALSTIRKEVRYALKRTGLLRLRDIAYIHLYSIREFDQRLDEANLTKLKCASIGFGPFTIFSHKIFTDKLGAKIQTKLQQYADNNFPILGSIGSQYVILGRKSCSDPNSC